MRFQRFIRLKVEVEVALDILFPGYSRLRSTPWEDGNIALFQPVPRQRLRFKASLSLCSLSLFSSASTAPKSS